MPKRATLTTRSLTSPSTASDQIPKNSGLVGSELDSNFLELRDQTFGVVADDSSTIDIKAGDTLYLQGGTNCTTSTNSDGSVTINTQADQDVFKTISVAGQSDIVADSTTDSLTFVAGSNMTITTNASNDTITFASAGGGGSVGDLAITGSTIATPSNGDMTLETQGTDTKVRVNGVSFRAGPGSHSNTILVDGVAGGSDENSPHSLTIKAPGGSLNLSANVVTMSANLHVGAGGEDAGGILIEDNTITTARSSENLELDPLGVVQISGAYTLPKTDGTDGQGLVTNGSGVLSFANVGSAINIDGGTAASTYGAITAIDGGDAT